MTVIVEGLAFRPRFNNNLGHGHIRSILYVHYAAVYWRYPNEIYLAYIAIIQSNIILSSVFRVLLLINPILVNM